MFAETAGKISQEMAATLAGLNRTDFRLALARLGRDFFQVDFGDLDRELARGQDGASFMKCYQAPE